MRNVVWAFIELYNSFVPLHEIDSLKGSLLQTLRGGASPHHTIPTPVFVDGLRGEIQDDQLVPMVIGRGKALPAEHVRACGVYAIR